MISLVVFAGGVVKDQAEADEDTSWKERAAIAVGKCWQEQGIKVCILFKIKVLSEWKNNQIVILVHFFLTYVLLLFIVGTIYLLNNSSKNSL